MPQIAIQALGKSFGGRPVLHEISLDIEASTFVTLLGPSGCGKTTTLRLLAGFLEPDAGRITVDGLIFAAPGRCVPPERRRMGMVFQNYAVWPHLSVFENVAFGLRLQRLHGAAIRRRVEDILAAVGLDGLADRQPGALSGGQQQRVALARSLVVEPRILLLDEPLSNLDAKLRERMRSELKALQRRTGITFVYVTHDQAEAMALSDRIAVFDAGRLLQVGSPREVYERPVDLTVADFMGLVTKLPVRVLERTALGLRVAWGRHELLAVAAPSLSAQATQAILAVRPEAVRLQAQRQAGPLNGLGGRVIEATYLGNLVDYRIAIDDRELRAQGERIGAWSVGDEVWVGIAPGECMAMPADGRPGPSPPVRADDPPGREALMAREMAG